MGARDSVAFAALAALALAASPGDALASARKPRAEPPAAVATAPAAGRAARPAAAPQPAPRADRPLVTATAAGPGQAGYVHFFLLELPDGALEVQVGIELPDQRIAWSFPGLGATVSEFIEAGTVIAGDAQYEVWHLYGIRPFPDDASMAALQKQLVGRVRPWIEAKTPYCENEGRRSGCMSCLGFVLRALFPVRADGYPGLPRDFARTGTAGRYTTKDLLLYLAGMHELPTRQARLERIARLTLPDDLREDLENFVHAMGASGPRPGARPALFGARPTQRGRL
jgi:hypothetical protein